MSRSIKNERKSKARAVANLGEKSHLLTPIQSMQRTMAYAKQAKENRNKATYKDTPGGVDPSIWGDMSDDDKEYFAGQGFNTVSAKSGNSIFDWNDWKRGKGNYQLEGHENQNSGFWQEAAYEMGFGTVKKAEDLLEVRKKADELGITDLDSYEDVIQFRKRLEQEPELDTKTTDVKPEEPAVDTSVVAIDPDSYELSTEVKRAKDNAQKFETALQNNAWGPKIFNKGKGDKSSAPAQDFLDGYKLDLKAGLEKKDRNVMADPQIGMPRAMGDMSGV